MRICICYICVYLQVMNELAGLGIRLVEDDVFDKELRLVKIFKEVVLILVLFVDGCRFDFRGCREK